MAKSRFQKMFSFWLNLNDDDQYRLAETIDALKEARLFSKAIRDGIRILAGLLQNDITPLVELYPWTVDAFLNRFGTPQNATVAPSNGGGGGNVHTSDDNALRSHLERLEHLIMQQAQPVAAAGNTIPGAANVQFTPPPLDDDMDDIFAGLEVKQDTSTASAGNFLAQLTAMQAGEGVWAKVASEPSKRSGRGKQSAYVEMEATV